MKIDIFFYGSYINRDVLREVDIVPDTLEPAVLVGFDLVISPRANLIPQTLGIAYGVIASATHAELGRLYSEHAKGVLGEEYLPVAVQVTDSSGRLRPALCYIAPVMQARPADPAYVERIARPAEQLGFPSGYIAHIRSFTP